MAAAPTTSSALTCDFLDGCRSACCSPLNIPYNAQVMSPLIVMTLKTKGGATITVGNQSRPPLNHTVIRSLKYGHTSSGGGGGFNLQLEISDESSNEFFPIYDTLNKELTFNRLSAGSQINVKWGWIQSTRTDSGMTDTLSNLTEHTCILNKVSCNYKHGLLTYILDACDISRPAFQASSNNNNGADDQPMPLKQAIRRLCKKYNVDVFFLRPTTVRNNDQTLGSGTQDEWSFGQGGQIDGVSNDNFPTGTWRENGSNLIQIIMNWIAPYKTDRGKGVTPSFNSRREMGTNEQLILWEGFYPGCKESLKACDYSLGTYIVNGGKNSPVISFQPTFEWYFGALNESGGGSSNTKNAQLVEKGDKDCNFGGKQDINRGNPTYNVNTADAVRNFGGSKSFERTVDSQLQHSKANAAFNSIKAELKIQGNPNLANPYTIPFKFISLIVISPYHLRKDIPQGRVKQTIDLEPCGDWLQQEPCHPVLSNKAWMITGTFHEIKEGSYTTTIQLVLNAPGSTISVGQPLGGAK